MDQGSPDSPEPSDEALMQALQSGQDRPLGVLMERWEMPLKAFLMRLGAGVEDAEDLAQETFVRLHARRGDFRPGAAFKPWILTLAANIARNRHRSFLRRRSREQASIEIEPIESDAEARERAGMTPANDDDVKRIRRKHGDCLA